MNLLERIIANLSESEKMEFKLSHANESNSPKHIMLFDLLYRRVDYTTEQLIGLLNTTNHNAYHSLRKRLMAHLIEFLKLQQLKSQVNNSSHVMGFISVAQFMIQNNELDMAKYLLKKAETIAIELQQFDLLDTIYNVQINFAEKLEINVDRVVEKWKENGDKLQAQQRLDVAYGLIKQKLSIAKKSGTTLDMDTTIAEVFKDFQISVEAANTPAYMIKIVNMARSVVISAKDYHRFEPFVVRIYSRLFRAKRFNDTNREIELQFLYIIAHTYYRNKKFAKAQHELEGMEKKATMRQLGDYDLISKFISLKAASASYSGDNLTAIHLLKEALLDSSLSISPSERLNMRLNLAVYYFQNAEFKTANKTITAIPYTNSWLEDKMGIEWMFKKNLIEVIIQVELGHDEIALSKIKYIEKQFKNFFEQQSYQRAKMFLQFIKRIVIEPTIIDNPKFAQQVIDAQMALPEEKEDLQAITFFAWWKAKISHQNYYETLLQAMKRKK